MFGKGEADPGPPLAGFPHFAAMKESVLMKAVGSRTYETLRMNLMSSDRTASRGEIRHQKTGQGGDI